MPFDEEELDPHGECAAEIERLKAQIERLQSALHAALADLKGTYCHVSSVTADRIKSITIPKAERALGIEQ